VGCSSKRWLSTCLVALIAGLSVVAAGPAHAVEDDGTTPYPMTMPVTGMVESLVGGGCPSRRSHVGIDISSPLGTATEIHATFSGTAYAVNRGDGYGLRVEIVHPFDGGAYVTRYAHLSQALVPETGMAVDQGDVIGMMGGSGNAQIVHLHFEIRLVVGTSDQHIDINAAFRPCRRNVQAGDPIPIEFFPLVSPGNGIRGMDVVYLGTDLGAAVLGDDPPILKK
jgi:murein DD-endopeptidase MepM/ murein hydrolase activator NlpD